MAKSTLRHDLEDWRLETVDNKKVLFYKGKNYTLKDGSLWWDLMRSYHDLETAGHPEELETYNLIKEHYWWPSLRSFVKNYVQGCSQCQQFKINRNPSHLAFLPTEGAISTRPFAHCSMDLITDLPPADRFDSILVVVDQGLSKGVILIPCNKTLMAEDTGWLLWDNLYRRFGLPDKIISNRRPQFASQGFKELLQVLGVKSALSTAYHPRPMEWLNGSTKKLKHIWQYTVYLIPKLGWNLSPLWNLLTTINDMLIGQKLHLNLCLAILQFQSLPHLNIPNFQWLKKNWNAYKPTDKKP